MVLGPTVKPVECDNTVGGAVGVGPYSTPGDDAVEGDGGRAARCAVVKTNGKEGKRLARARQYKSFGSTVISGP